MSTIEAEKYLCVKIFSTENLLVTGDADLDQYTPRPDGLPGFNLWGPCGIRQFTFLN